MDPEKLGALQPLCMFFLFQLAPIRLHWGASICGSPNLACSQVCIPHKSGFTFLHSQARLGVRNSCGRTSPYSEVHTSAKQGLMYCQHIQSLKLLAESLLIALWGAAQCSTKA